MLFNEDAHRIEHTH